MEIYAELTKKQKESLDSGAKLDLPEGVIVTRKSGSRACFFDCEDRPAYLEMIDSLEENRILWQDNG